MKSLLILPRIKVENANAISGIVYGFPAITHFLGFVHALSRELHNKFKGLKLKGCGVVCHNHQVHAHKTGGGGEYIFSLTRNPLSDDGKPTSFNEEGRVSLEVSLIIECDFTSSQFDFGTDDVTEDISKFEELVYNLAVAKRLAGGIIVDMSPVKFQEIPQDQDKAKGLIRSVLKKMLPGFILCDRSDVFMKYSSDNPEINAFEALIDFYALKSKAKLLSEEKADETNQAYWSRVSKEHKGWFVPIQSGYRAISPLYEAGDVACVRDRNTPFRFVEPIYGLGEWVGAHRIHNIEDIMWRYHSDNNMYVCLNKKK